MDVQQQQVKDDELVSVKERQSEDVTLTDCKLAEVEQLLTHEPLDQQFAINSSMLSDSSSSSLTSGEVENCKSLNVRTLQFIFSEARCDNVNVVVAAVTIL